MSFIDQVIDFTTKALNQNNNQAIKSISKQDYLAAVSSNSIHYLYLKYWKLVPNTQKNRMLITASLTLLSIYILAPTLVTVFQSQEEKDRMFTSKRQDKFTTGLINTRNDCFANSSIQAFAAMPGLDVYLNDILKQHKLLDKLPTNSEAPKLPLHEALATIVQELQVTITTQHYVSVWPFLQVIEKIFNSKISTNQNDAHELVQLILETLDNENTKLKKFVKQSNLNFVIPEMPFNGLLADQLTCLSCLNSSKPSFHPFAVLSLAVPQTSITSLEEMVKKNEVETINGYNCLRCKIKAILKVEKDQPTNSTAETQKLVAELKQKESNISINDDLPEDLDKFVKNYSYGGFKTENLQSTIVKKTLVVKPPRLLTVHLSRSMFTGTQVTRNSCRVQFEDVLAINLDENLAKAYHKKQKLAKKLKKGIDTSLIEEEKEEEENDADDDDDDEDDDFDGYDEDRNEPQQLARIHSKVLTTHEENATYTDPEEDQSTTHDQFSENSQSQSDNTSPESDEHPDEEVDEEDGEEEDASSDEDNELNASKENVKYRLRAVIRHHGTHNAGHYECYRHKPALVKDTLNDTVVNTSPTINFGEDIPESTPQVVVNTNEEPLEVPASPSQVNGGSPSAAGVQRSRSTRLRRLSEKVSNRPSVPTSPKAANESLSRASATGDEAEDTDDDPSHFTRFRNRIGSIVSRRPSISMTSPNVGSRRGSVSNNAQQMLASNSQSSGALPELQEGFAGFQLNSNELSSKSHNKRFKKIATVAKYPFWRISDTKVAEVKKEDVLRETQAVYMIYYERV